MLEMLLSLSYSLLVFGNRPESDQAEVIVIEGFESLATWNAKANLMTAAAKFRFGEETAKDLTKLLKKLRNIQERRNNVVHARWFTSKTEPGKWIRKRTFLGTHGAQVYDAACFTTLSDDIRSGMTMLNNFFAKLRERLQLEADLYHKQFMEMIEALKTEESKDTPES